MIKFRKEDDKIIATYIQTNGNSNWLFDKFKKGEECTFQKTYTFSVKDLMIPLYEQEALLSEDPFPDAEPIDFLFAVLEGAYYKVTKSVLVDNFDIFIHQGIKFITKMFVAEGNTPIFREIERVINEDIYIGGDFANAIPEDVFYSMINMLPNGYEKRLFTDARVSSVIREYFVSTKNAELKFNNYVNKKIIKKSVNVQKLFKEIDLFKYETIYDRLKQMLSVENEYSETAWQNEILQIILLLYPKYIYAFTEVPIRNNLAEGIKEKHLDFLLVDCDGNVDVVEIKKPFDNVIVTKGQYRDNFIPLRELSGTIMQIEKYIYYLNRWSYAGEKFLTDKYKEKLPDGFKIKITNPGGFIIMGRETNLSTEQKSDFEVIKRKYKNVTDIITYDNLLERLKFTIAQIKTL